MLHLGSILFGTSISTSFDILLKMSLLLYTMNVMWYLLNLGPEAHGQAYFGQGQGDIYLENVQCNGSERSLEDCPASDPGLYDCHHSEDAGIKCQSMSLDAYTI